MNTSPLITIILPAHNAGDHLADAVNSILKQTFSEWKLLIIDDCSNDNTSQVATAYVDADARIEHLRNPKNLGVAGTRNRGLDLVSTEFVAFIDADDEWMPKKLEKQLSLMLAESIDFCCTAYEVTDPDRKPMTHFTPKKECNYTWLLCERNDPLPSATMYKFTSFRHHRFPTLSNCEDLGMWLSMLRRGGHVRGMSDILTRYRRHPRSLSHRRLTAYWNRFLLFRHHENMGIILALQLVLSRRFKWLKPRIQEK